MTTYANTTSRRTFIGMVSAMGLSGLGAGGVSAQMRMPTRLIPLSGEALPVIGLGSSRPVDRIASEGTESITRILRTLVEHGGSVIDTWPRNPQNDAGLGEVLSLPELRDALFVTSKIDRTGREAGLAQFRETQRLYRRDTLDLLQLFNLADLYTHWPTLQQLKDSGETRYIGVTVSHVRLYDELERFLAREQPDFIQVNYSVTERESEQRILPLAADNGVAIIINRPFMDGAYFERLEGVPVPGWCAEFDCTTWAHFSLKYILANPLPTCVLTETTNPAHMAENALAASGRMPDERARARMRELIDEVI